MLLSAISLQTAAKPEFFQLQRKGSLRFLSEANYFSTESNYSSEGGSFTELEDGRYYKNLRIDVGGQYALSHRLYLGGALGWARAESFDGGFTRTNATVTEAQFWGQYVVFAKPVRLVPELIFMYPFNRIEKDTDNVLTGEGAMVIQPGVWLTKRWRSFELLSYVGVKYQDEGRATLLPYRIGAQMFLNRFFFGGSLNGYEVVIDDEKLSTPSEKTTVVNRVNGRSLRYYAINPSLMEADAWFGFRFSPTSLFRLGYSQTLNGENTAEGYTIHAGLQFELISASSSRRRRSPPAEQFEIKKDEYDESLFQEEPQRPRRRRPQPQPQGPSEEELLQDTMNQLEM